MRRGWFINPYLVAGAAAFAAFGLRSLLDPLLGSGCFFLPFVPAVILSAWYGGSRPGILTTALGAILALIPDPSGPLAVIFHRQGDATRLALFLATCGIATTLIQSMHDANARAQRENQERMKAEDALRLADQRKDEFLALLAHELRNPLGTLQNVLTLLVPRCQTDEKAARHLELGQRQLEVLCRLARDLMDVSRIARGRLEMRSDRVDLRAVIGGAAEVARDLVSERRQTLRLDLPPEPVWVIGDAVRLEQVVSNLLTNALKYTPSGGRIELLCEAGAEQARFAVRDNGVGIRPEFLSRVFDLYAQEDFPPDQRRDGLGIGLSLVKSLVERHGGRVEVTSDGPGCGATFTVLLPLAPEKIPAS